MIATFLLIGCSTTKNHMASGNIKTGMTKQEFCLEVNSFKFSQDVCKGFVETNEKNQKRVMKYYPGIKKEILTDEKKEFFFVFKNVNFPYKEPGNTGDGVLALVAKNFDEAYAFAHAEENNKNQNKADNLIFTGAATFPDSKANKKNNKMVQKYMGYPDKILCISYINNYGIFFTKSKQEARAEAIRIRKLDCSQYRDDAFYDKQDRTNAIIDATKKALDENAENKRRQAELYKNRNINLDCTSRRVGDRISTSCY